MEINHLYSLGAIVQKFSVEHVVSIVTELGTLATSVSSDGAKDNYAQGIRTILKELPLEHASAASKKLAPIMIEGIKNPNIDPDHRILFLVIMGDLLRGYGNEFTDMHDNILQVLIELLEHPKSGLRKEVSLEIGAFVGICQESAFEVLMTNLIEKTGDQRKEGELLFNYLQTIAIVR